jgi:phosphonate transport system substrate-binding protein
MKNVKLNFATAGALVFFAILTGTSGSLYAGGQKAAGSASSVPAGWPQELVLCYLPNEASEELAEYRSALQGELTAALGIQVREINVADYNAVVEAMRTKHADVVYYGPVSYVQAAERAGAEAMVTPAIFGDKSRAGYTSKIIVRAGSPIKTLGDLRGKTFAFVDPASTSGNYVPTLELMNIFPGMTNEDFHTNGRFFSSVSFSGKHQNGLQGVINGDIDGAPVASDILAAEIAAGRVKESDFMVIHESPRIPSSPMAIRKDLPTDLKAKVKQFLLGYKDPDYFQFMLGMSSRDRPQFVEAFDRDYDYARDLMAKVMPK